MKKIVLFNILVLLVASSAFAAENASTAASFSTAGKKVIGSGGPASAASIGKLSTKVALGWKTSATGYAINTQHQQGTKAYGTSYDSTSIFVTDVKIGTATAVPSKSDSGSFSGWTTM